MQTMPGSRVRNPAPGRPDKIFSPIRRPFLITVLSLKIFKKMFDGQSGNIRLLETGFANQGINAFFVVLRQANGHLHSELLCNLFDSVVSASRGPVKNVLIQSAGSSPGAFFT
jgi:hypothetical protein